MGAAVDLLRRGAALPCANEQRLGLLLEMADPLWERGHTGQGLSALEEVEHSNLATLAARARALGAAVAAYDFRPGHTAAAAEATVRQQLPILEEAADLLGQAEAHYLLALLSSLRGRCAESLDSAEKPQIWRRAPVTRPSSDGY